MKNIIWYCVGSGRKSHDEVRQPAKPEHITKRNQGFLKNEDRPKCPTCHNMMKLGWET